MEISSGIHRIDRVRGANCYLVNTAHELLVIDTGMPGNGRKIVEYVRGLGKNESDITYVILTHADIDHVGSAAEMKKMTGARLAISARDAPILSGEKGFKRINGPLGILFKLMTPLIRFQSLKPDVILADDFQIGDLKVIPAPGHTYGSVCLYLPGKVIFVGDALRSDPGGNPKPPSRHLSADVAQAKASLATISRLEFDILLPGHGAPVMGNAAAKVKDLVAHLQ